LLGYQKGWLVLKRFFREDGVSLIETMIGLVIVSILLIAGAPSFSQFMQNRKVRNAADAITNGLSLAKTEAVSRNTNVTFTLTADTGWTVGCAVATEPSCSASIHTRSGLEGSGGAVVPATTIIFNGYGRMAAGSADATIDVTNPIGTCERDGGNMRCLRVVVSTAGRVRTCDPRLTVTNPTSPQAC
jgi:type IV fimbrial biogenesis protein FimT